MTTDTLRATVETYADQLAAAQHELLRAADRIGHWLYHSGNSRGGRLRDAVEQVKALTAALDAAAEELRQAGRDEGNRAIAREAVAAYRAGVDPVHEVPL